ncbi:hypothetical protein ACK3YF_12075 [Aeromonas allosaccharophila]|uniref:hypothetical protein n=1 Tax=Aeromonas allosaccharophila TaxID=656 RepID=UPI00398591BB
MSNIFQARKELKVGKIIEVSGNNLRIEIDDDVNELIRAVDGQVYPVGQMGSIIKVHFGRKLLFAFVRSLKMRSDLISDDSSQLISTADDARILEADLFGQGIWSNNNSRLEFSRGVETYPLPLQSAYICLNDELEAVLKLQSQMLKTKPLHLWFPLVIISAVIMQYAARILINCLAITLQY